MGRNNFIEGKFTLKNFGRLEETSQRNTISKVNPLTSILVNPLQKEIEKIRLNNKLNKLIFNSGFT